MSRENLPPQAYTKETLASAITWIQTQPEHVKSLVSSQSALITLYLKWKRNGAAALDSLSPAYHERLRSDLKSIRAVMDQFDPNAPAPALAATSAAATSKSNEPQPSTITPHLSTANPTHLDIESQKRVSLVRERLNLSSDSEALRVLISMGFDRMKDQLPRP